MLSNGLVWKEEGARAQGCMGVWVNRTAVGLTTCGGRQDLDGGGRDADYGIGIIGTREGNYQIPRCVHRERNAAL